MEPSEYATNVLFSVSIVALHLRSAANSAHRIIMDLYNMNISNSQPLPPREFGSISRKLRPSGGKRGY
jgi:hypothetical protein